jgi:hypothetical protein
MKAMLEQDWFPDRQDTGNARIEWACRPDEAFIEQVRRLLLCDSPIPEPLTLLFLLPLIARTGVLQSEFHHPGSGAVIHAWRCPRRRTCSPRER